MATARKVKVGWQHPETEEAFTVRLSVTPGSPGRGPSLDGPGEPPEGPEIEVLEVTADATGEPRPDLVEMVEKALDAGELSGEVERRERDERDAYEESRADALREERAAGRH